MIEKEIIRRVLGPLQLPDSELVEFSQSLESPPPVAIRPRPGLDPGSLPFATQTTPWHERGLFITDGTRPGSQLHYAVGDYYIQDAASLLAITLLNAQSGERICDLCAAPGGKATAVLESLGDDGWLLANETIFSRLAPLRFNMARHGFTRFAMCQRDPAWLADALGAAFDAVLVDAPCSGQSLLGRSRQTASAFGLRAVEHCAARQTRILSEAARLVRPGGRLVYSTCTFSFLENEGQIETFLEAQSSWRLEPQDSMRAWESDALPGSYRSWPHRDHCGGAFAAVLRRDERATEQATSRGRKERSLLKPAFLPDEFVNWGAMESAFVRSTNERCFAWTSELWPHFQRVCHEGPEIAFRKGRTWFPAYALAMRRDVAWSPIAQVSLDDREAEDYIKGLTLATCHRGWAIATWQGRPLGWLKGDGARAKNHLPKPARRA